MDPMDYYRQQLGAMGGQGIVGAFREDVINNTIIAPPFATKMVFVNTKENNSNPKLLLLEDV